MDDLRIKDMIAVSKDKADELYGISHGYIKCAVVDKAYMRRNGLTVALNDQISVGSLYRSSKFASGLWKIAALITDPSKGSASGGTFCVSPESPSRTSLNRVE